MHVVALSAIFSMSSPFALIKFVAIVLVLVVSASRGAGTKAG
jgi:hypothetical protein